MGEHVISPPAEVEWGKVGAVGVNGCARTFSPLPHLPHHPVGVGGGGGGEDGRPGESLMVETTASPRSLHPYQATAIAGLHAAMRTHRRVLLQLPTGAGKTVVAATIVKRALAKEKQVALLVHRDELLSQASRTLREEGIPHGLIVAGQPDPVEPIVVASVQTLVRRLDHLPTPDLILIDEAHHAVAGMWERVLKAWPDAYVVGLTATPERQDGRGLSDVFQVMIIGPQTADLIAAGYLSPYRAFAPSMPDLSGVRTAKGDFDQTGLAAVYDRPCIIGDIVAHYQRLASGKGAILFASGIEQSRHLAAAFNEAGIAAAHVDGGTPKEERKAIIGRFAAGEVKVLCNVDLFGEGFDVPAVEAVILARPTQSLALHLQQIGRALRAAPGKEEAIILDHAGNLERHGLPDEKRTWRLNAGRRETNPRRPGTAARRCPECSAVHRPATTCPACGWQYPRNDTRVSYRQGKLVEVPGGDWTGGIDIKTAQGRKLKELIARAGNNRRRLERIARARGYKRKWIEYRLEEATAAAGWEG